MNITRTGIAAIILSATAGVASAQEVGTYLPSLDLKDFGGTQIGSYDNLLGRTVLIEFFAYW